MPINDITALSVTQLAWVCRKDIKGTRLKLRELGLAPVKQDGRSEYYDPRDAIPALLGKGEGLSPQAEKARLDKARADVLEIELQLKREQVIPRSDLQLALAALADAFTSRLEGLSATLSHEVIACGQDHAKVQDCIEDGIRRLRESVASEADLLGADAEAVAAAEAAVAAVTEDITDDSDNDDRAYDDDSYD